MKLKQNSFVVVLAAVFAVRFALWNWNKRLQLPHATLGVTLQWCYKLERGELVEEPDLAEFSLESGLKTNRNIRGGKRYGFVKKDGGRTWSHRGWSKKGILRPFDRLVDERKHKKITLNEGEN